MEGSDDEAKTVKSAFSFHQDRRPGGCLKSLIQAVTIAFGEKK